MFNWSEDAVKVKQKDIEIIVTDNFEKGQANDESFEFEEINLDEDSEEE